MSNFAAIMDMSGRETDEKIKSILTNIFCGLSIICLILTIVLSSTHKRKISNPLINKMIKIRKIITTNLSFMLIITNKLIIFGMNRNYEKNVNNPFIFPTQLWLDALNSFEGNIYI